MVNLKKSKKDKTDQMAEYWDGEERRTQTTVRARFDQLEDRFRRFFMRALVAFAVLGLANTVALAGFGITLGNRAADQTAIRGAVGQTRSTVDDLATLQADVQDQRYKQTVNACKLRNKQNRGTRAVFKRFVPGEVPPKILAYFPIEPSCNLYAKEAISK